MSQGLSLAVRGLRVDDDRGRSLLDVPSLDLPPGTCLGVGGPSGAGKSTFLFALAGLASRVSGRILWGETDILALANPQRTRFRRERMGLIFQDYLLFDELGAAANAALAAAFETHERRRQIEAQAAQILDRLNVPRGARSVTSFSGGERQRVGVARAMATKPSILLADEPTASLDRQAADAIVTDLIAMVREGGATLVAVSHDPSVIARMDQVIELDRGRVVETRAARSAA